jgi:hypothetical protein
MLTTLERRRGHVLAIMPVPLAAAQRARRYTVILQACRWAVQLGSSVGGLVPASNCINAVIGTIHLLVAMTIVFAVADRIRAVDK